MSIADEINKAIGAHGMWKARLKNAITTGSSDFTVENVSVDNKCDFGKWFYSLPSDLQSSEDFKKIKDLHAKFHKETGRILGLALSGKKDEANNAIGMKSLFSDISAELTTAMMAWKGKVG